MIEMILAVLAQLATVPAAVAATLKPAFIPTMAAPQVSLGNPTILSAIIGAGAAIAVMLLRDGLFAWIKTLWLRKQTDAEIYRRYLSPLAEACAKIVWRNKEIFLEHRHAFLNTATLPRDYNEYKRISTLYRIASLLVHALMTFGTRLRQDSAVDCIILRHPVALDSAPKVAAIDCQSWHRGGVTTRRAA